MFQVLQQLFKCKRKKNTRQIIFISKKVLQYSIKTILLQEKKITENIF